jgi:hypothetical protein
LPAASRRAEVRFYREDDFSGFDKVRDRAERINAKNHVPSRSWLLMPYHTFNATAMPGRKSMPSGQPQPLSGMSFLPTTE